MFGRSGSNEDSRIKSIISAETFVQGTLRTHGSLVVEGKIEGDIYDAKKILIGEGGQVQGDIFCEVVTVAGKVSGNIQATKHVQILTRGQVVGDVRTKSLHIEEGAVFDGTCTMNLETSQGEKGANSVSPQKGHAAVPVK